MTTKTKSPAIQSHIEDAGNILVKGARVHTRNITVAFPVTN